MGYLHLVLPAMGDSEINEGFWSLDLCLKDPLDGSQVCPYSFSWPSIEGLVRLTFYSDLLAPSF